MKRDRMMNCGQVPGVPAGQGQTLPMCNIANVTAAGILVGHLHVKALREAA